MEEGKGERYLASGRQYGNALLGVRHQEEEDKLFTMKGQNDIELEVQRTVVSEAVQLHD